MKIRVGKPYSFLALFLCVFVVCYRLFGIYVYITNV
nr:MAG TPA: hypothetical protein [Caudoviricetes sp.]